MAVDRPLNTPVPINQDMGEIEIQIENPDSVSVETEDGGILIDFDPQAGGPAGADHNANLAEFIDEKELNTLSSELVGQFKTDKESRSDWERSYIDGLELLGLKHEDRTTPWDGACGVFHPLLTEAVIRFQSQAIQELFPASGPVRTNIVGAIDAEKEKQAHRVQN